MSDDFVLSVRQVTEYPLKAAADPGDAVLLQVGGLGGPYVYTTAYGVAQALGGPDGQVGIGMPLPGDAVGAGVLTTDLVTPLGCTISFNAYNNAFGGQSLLQPGGAGRFCFDGNTLTWSRLPGAAPFFSWGTLLSLGPAGAMTLPLDTLTVARDPQQPLEVATKAYADSILRQILTSVVLSWNGRRGNVTLLLSDIVASGGAPNNSPELTGIPTAPTIRGLDARTTQIANADWVQQVIVCRINDVLVGHPFVFRFNGRTGNVWLCEQDLVAADGLTVNSRIDATIIVSPEPPECPRPGQLWWDSDDPDGGALYVWYVDKDSAQWVVAGGVGAQGQQGIPGEDGEPGKTGPQGAPGSTGAQGPQGPPGPTGAGLEIKGVVADASQLPVGGNTTGDIYVTDDTKDAWVWDGTQWINVGPVAGIPGPQGPPGPVGSTGPAGPTGPIGPAGPQGVPGPDGPQGPQGTPGGGLAFIGIVNTAGDLPPTGNVQGNIYLARDTGHLWVWESGAWRDTDQTLAGTVTEAPLTGGPYGRQGGVWVQLLDDGVYP